jgi:tetratricopeptide (TPR) repeat protein
MSLKKIKLSVTSGKRSIDPSEIFTKLTLRGSIENIWEPQGEALKTWHQNRSNSDVVVQMNTGGGKTLVGLLIAQSLTNETKGRVLYVCANNQLIEQTVGRAKEVGLSPAIRYKGDWIIREEYESGNVFCVTNYATVFNGKSIFRTDTIEAIVFDDAHVAENLIRGQYTVHIPRSHDAYKAILNMCRKHFANSSEAEHFKDIAEGRFSSVLFIPMFVVWEHAAEFRKLLLDSGIEQDDGNVFAWAHLKGHLNHCCFLADASGLEITPAVLPLKQLNYFDDGVRRVYLTATLPSQASFARTYGVSSPSVVKPSGKSGDAQRLFVFTPGEDDEEQRKKSKEMVSDLKSCVISPSYKKGQEWVPPANIYSKESGQEEIDRFCASKEPEMLGLVARYDGIDLPGDACKTLILDGLPRGDNMIDRFIDESVRVETIRMSRTATRVVQAIGRIFRSNTDHGVAFLVGPELQGWVRGRKNRMYLPERLQQQLLLAVELSKKVVAEEMNWTDLVTAVLEGDDNWDEMYNEYIEQFETSVSSLTTDWHVELLLQEHNAFAKLWEGQYEKAVYAYSELESNSSAYDERLMAWYRHWHGLALLCSGDRQGAFAALCSAANNRAELGRPSMTREAAFKPPKAETIGNQATLLAKYYRKNKKNVWRAIEQTDTDLVYGPDTNKAEEALKLLGWLLGLRAERPDNKKHTGPDVTWAGHGHLPAVGFELKTNKNKDGEYSKTEISQCHDHENWLSTNHGEDSELIVVGPILPVSPLANPSAALQIAKIDSFRELLTRVKATFESVEGGDKTNLEQSFQTWFDYYGLNWPNCVISLDCMLAVDLKTR